MYVAAKPRNRMLMSQIISIDGHVLEVIDAAIDLISDRYRMSIRPVYKRTKHDRYEFVGSSTFLCVDEMKILATAAHVYDHVQDGGLFVQGEINFVGISGKAIATNPSDSSRKDDRYDFACIMLDEETLAALGDCIFIQESDCITRTID